MKFKIPVTWMMWGEMEVEAETEEEAFEKSFDAGLPEGVYIEDSFSVDREGYEIRKG